MIGLPPGNILQYLYLKERLGKLFAEGKRKFLEIGSGNGNISKLMLDMGFEGIGLDMNNDANENNRELNKSYINSGKYRVENKDFLKYSKPEKADIVISAMVIEHLTQKERFEYFKKSKQLLNPNGVIISLVPASKKHWGIEDEIAGHIMRYEFEDFEELAEEHSLEIAKLAGLTYPLSNLLFGLSNKIIKKAESSKLKLTQKEKTVYTGNREVSFKTRFPRIFNLILNPLVMYPLHIVQKCFAKNKNSLVIYSELKLKS